MAKSVSRKKDNLIFSLQVTFDRPKYSSNTGYLFTFFKYLGHLKFNRYDGLLFSGEWLTNDRTGGFLC